MDRNRVIFITITALQQRALNCTNRSDTFSLRRYFRDPPTGNPFNYNSFGATATEVQIDCLSGEVEVLSVDMLFDCGQSLNPAVDLGWFACMH